MIALRRPLLSLVSLATLLVLPAAGQDVKETFHQGVEQLERGQYEEALSTFQKVLAMDPSHEDAYELWQKANHDVWSNMLARGGQMEVVAKALMQLSSLGRSAKSRDEDAIREKLAGITSADVLARTKAVSAMAAEHGEFAVPYMVYGLGDQASGDKGVLTMQALTRMGDDVVLPLVAALDTGDAYLRRNVALTLGYIGDRRAAAALAQHAFGDEDGTVRSAASKSLEKVGGSSDVAAAYLAMGNAYYAESDSVLMPHQVSPVVWRWEGKGLVADDIPRFLYAPELAKRAYRAALAADPGNRNATAGLARCIVTQKGRLEEWEALGQDAGDWGDRVANDEVAVQFAGPAALDLALGWALDQGDQTAASGLCQALAASALEPTANLRRALSSGSTGAVRGEAAVAMAQIAGGAAGAETVAALTEAAARSVLQIVVVIDGNDARRAALTKALESRGYMVTSWTTGGRGLAALRTVPGVDLVLVASELEDLSLSQVVTELKIDPRTSQTPVYVIGDSEGDYGDAIEGVVSGAAEVDAVEASLAGGLDGDRDQANRLAARAAESLLALVGKGVDISGSAASLVLAIDGRPDEVTAPALGALGLCGGAAQVDAIVAVLADDGRTDEIRSEAARALGRIFARTGSASKSAMDAVSAVARSEAPLGVRKAAAGALGRLELTGEMREALINK